MQGDCVQLEQSNMHLALSMVKMAKGGISCTGMEEMQYCIKMPCAEVHEENNQGVEIPWHRNVKAAMERHPATVRENLIDGGLPCLNGTAQNPQTHWRRKGTGVSRLDRLGQPTLEPMPSWLGMLLLPPVDYEGTNASEMKRVPPGYVYIHTPLPSAQWFNVDAYAKDCKRDTHFIPDLMTDEGTSTG